MAWYVYRGINRSRKEVYYGVSSQPKERIDGAHCVGYTKTIKHWDCENEDIIWNQVSEHATQQEASKKAHAHEKIPLKGYKVHQTAGI